MKKIILFTLLLLSISTSYAQRFLTPQFDSVAINNEIQYGFNFNVNGDSTKLFLDLYQPYGDTLASRPVLVLAHGGSFVQGNKRSADMVKICTEMAKRGYVVASIQYRLGISIGGGKTLETVFREAVWRGTQDGRAAVRFMRKHIAEGNAWKLNTDQFYTGGVSAGGVLGLQLACLDLPSELASIGLDTLTLGGIEGNSGNAGYSWKVNGVINLCGALGNVNWMSNNTNISLCNMHGDLDKTVPYKTDYFKFLSSPVSILQGGFSVDSAAKSLGVNSRLYTFNGADHVPFVGTTATNLAYMDTTINYISTYLYRFVTGNIPASTHEVSKKSTNAKVYPNPSNGSINFANFAKGSPVQILDLNGKVVLSVNVLNPIEQVELNLSKGLYVIYGYDEQNAIYLQKIVIE